MADLFLKSEHDSKVSKNIIFIHGLGGDVHKTWSVGNNSEFFWPRWLIEDFNNISIWSVGYKASISRFFGTAMHLPDRAENIFALLRTEEKLNKGEIVLIGHSLGGLIIKQILRIADGMSLHDTSIKVWLDKIKRIGFLATPHAGSGLATIGDRFSLFVKPSSATAGLVRNAPYLRDLNLWYRDWSIAKKIHHLILTENIKTRFVGMVVKPDSSDPGLLSRPIPVDADHISISKPESKDSEIYRLISSFIQAELSDGDVENKIEGKLDIQTDQIKQLSDKTHKNHLSLEERLLQIQTAMSEQAQKASEIIGTETSQSLINTAISKNLSRIRKSRFFPGFDIGKESIQLAEKIKEGEYRGAADEIKSQALSWCARFLVYGDKKEKAEEYTKSAKKMGNGLEVLAAEAFLTSSQGNMELALSLLNEQDSNFLRSAKFFIVSHHKNAPDTVAWLSIVNYTILDLDSDGKILLLTKLFESNQWDDAFRNSEKITSEDMKDSPALIQIKALANLFQIVPEELREYILKQPPLEAKTFPLSSDEASLQLLRKAKSLFRQASEMAKTLNCSIAANFIDDYAIWLELRDPTTNIVGIEKLKEYMRNPKYALRRLHLALQYHLEVDLKSVEEEIERQTALSGGHSYDAAIARFSLAFVKKSPIEVAEYIERHRSQLEKHLGIKTIKFFEIEIFSKSGQKQKARDILNSLVDNGISDSEYDYLDGKIAEINGIDKIPELKKQYESSKSIMDLTGLVLYFEKEKDWETLTNYALKLFNKTKDLADAVRYVISLNNTEKFKDITNFLDEYPEFIRQSEDIRSILSWAYYYEGRLEDSSVILKKLQASRKNQNDSALSANLAITSGNWEALHVFVEEEWAERENRSSIELIRTANLAQSIDSNRTKDFAIEAVERDENDPAILISAYGIATKSGWEDHDLVAKWMNEAIRLSDEKGPVQKMSLQDILDRKPKWEQLEKNTWDSLYQAAVPVFGAGKALNRTLIDFMLFPAVANPQEDNSTKRFLIPAFSGGRPNSYKSCKIVTIDPTALLTLGLLGLVEYLDQLFDQIIIPHSTLRWLFEEKQQISFHQPSRIKIAQSIRQLISRDQLKPLVKKEKTDADLAAVVGDELASLISEALSEVDDGKQRLVVRSAPVHRVDSLMQEEADLTIYNHVICGCMAVVDKLKEKGQITATEEEQARAYIQLHEREWPKQVKISDNAILYLDDLTVSYLQHTGLLEKIQAAGLKAYISPRKIDEINSLINFEQLTSTVDPIIESIRTFLRDGILSNKIRLGGISSKNKSEDELGETHPSIEVIELAKEVEALISDDRFINQHIQIENTFTLTTLDLLLLLNEKNIITSEKWMNYLTKLRQVSYVFIPISQAELNHYLASATIQNNRIIETAELKAIRENFLQIRMSKYLKVPNDVLWLVNFTKILSDTLKAQWKGNVDLNERKAKSDWLFELLDLRGWSVFYEVEAAENMVKYCYGSQIMSLVFIPSEMPQDSKNDYWKWIEEKAILTIKEENSELYSWILKSAENLLQQAIKDQNDKDRLSIIIISDMRFFSPSIRESLLQNSSFVENYNLKVDATVSFGVNGVSLKRSEFFKNVKAVLAQKDRKHSFIDAHSKEFSLELNCNENASRLELTTGEQRLFLPDFLTLSSNKDERLKTLKRDSKEVNLPTEAETYWHNILSKRVLSDDELNNYQNDINNTPKRVLSMLVHEVEKGTSEISSFVPESMEYYERLIGKYQDQANILDFAQTSSKEHVENLILKQQKDGFLWALISSSHSSIAESIDIRGLMEEDILSVYDWLFERGDVISQVGGIEVGFSILDKYPNLEPYLEKLILKIKVFDDKRFSFLSALIMMVDGELSRLSLFSDKPPFYRRLASIAQASLIERAMTPLPIDLVHLTEWATKARGQSFYFQSLIDLRTEPRWLPDFVAAQQLHAECIGRIVGFGQKNSSILSNFYLNELITGKGENSLQSEFKFPFPFLPGPLEGSIQNLNEPPKELLNLIKEQLEAEDIQADSFGALVNSSLLFNIDSFYVKLAAKAIRTVKYHLNTSSNDGNLVYILRGLATVAAASRSDELAKELRVLVRRCKHELGTDLPSEDVLCVGLIAAACFSNKLEWSEFIGEWLTDISFQHMTKDEINTIHSHVLEICRIDHDLWRTVGRAETALKLRSRVLID